MCKIGMRLPILAVLHTLCFCLIATSAPSDSVAVAERRPALRPEELTILDELVEWVGSDTTPSTPWELGEEPIAETIRSRSTSFDLFRYYHDEDARGSRLDGVPYGAEIRRAAERHGIDPFLVAAVAQVESGFDPQAISPRGALGLMQVRPQTAGISAERLLEPAINLDFGSAYLRRLLRRYGGDLELALAAYNAGPTAVRRYGGVPPFRETESYVEKVLGLYVEHHRRLWQASETGERLALL